MAAVAPAFADPRAHFGASIAPRTQRTKLRLGVFADSPLQPRWIVEALAKVAASEHAEILVIATDEPRETQGVRDPGGAAPLVWRAYRSADRWLFGRRTDSSQRSNLELLVPQARRLRLEDGEGLAWRSRVAALRLDIAFALGEVDDAALEGLSRYGVWRYCFGEAQGISEPLAGVREVLDEAPVLASGLRIHYGGERPDRLAYQSWSRTYSFSLARSRDALFAKTAEFIARAVRDLHFAGASWLEHSTHPARELCEERFAGAAGALRDLARLSTRVVRRAVERCLTVDQWSIAYRFSPEESWSGSLEGFFRLEPPGSQRFWADPFPWVVNGRYFIFFEELPMNAAKAHISVVEVDREGRASAPTRVLERDYHLSYPFLIEEAGRLYMIPETAQNHTVEIYRCVDFPAKWRLEKVLLRNAFCADATIERVGERWWMFANVACDGAEVNDELHLFSAPELFGEWQAHVRNPVKSDVRSARPAGRLFWQGGELYRPSQICAPLYGSGIALQRVTHLSASGYGEQEERRILPAAHARSRGARVQGIHTINRAGDLSVMDAYTRRVRF